MSTIRHPLRASWLALTLTMAMSGIGLLSSCGGGVGDQASATGNTGGVGSGGTGSYTNGPISGLGSIIVNGVRYDVSGAKVQSDESDGGNASLDSTSLDLGMQVEVSSGVVTPPAVLGELPTAVATDVRFASALVGPVSVAPDVGCSCLTVLGQKVTYTSATNMPVGLGVNDVIEVFGQPDLSTHALVATRVQRVTALNPVYKLVGWVASGAAINPAAYTLTVQGPSTAVTLTYSDAQASQVNALADDDVHRRPVRVWMRGSVSALVLDHLRVDQPLVSDRDEARLEGLVTSVLNATTGHLAIHGTAVDASAAPATVRTMLAGLALGDRVRVDGQMVAGVLRVDEAYVAGSGEDDEDDGKIELHGAPRGVALAGDGKSTMTVRDVPVIFVTASAPPGLTESSCVEVEGKAYDALGRLVADVVKSDDSCRH